MSFTTHRVPYKSVPPPALDPTLRALAAEESLPGESNGMSTHTLPELGVSIFFC